MTGGPPPVVRPRTTPHLRAASLAVFLTFTGAGFAFASWAARIPQVRAALQVSPGVLGLILLAGAVGSGTATPLSGLIITWLGETRTVAFMSVLAAAGLVTVAVGYRLGIPPVAAGLFLFGFGSGSWDVAMNVHGAAVEQALGRSLMPRFHAGWSVGTVAGAGLGAAMVALGVPVTVHLLAVAALTAAAIPAATRGFLRPGGSTGAVPRSGVLADDTADPASATASPAGAAPNPAGAAATPAGATATPAGATATPAGPAADPAGPGAAAARRGPLAAWLEPRTLVIGLFVLCATVTEGAGNDWLSLAMIDGFHAAAVLGTLAFAIFLAGMTAGRWFGPRLIDAWGRVRALRACTATALAGLLLIVFGPLPAAVAGAVLMGLGTSLGFPVGMSAAADDPRYAAGRVSTTASIGYVAFLAGPPMIGFLSDHIGVRHGLSAAAVLLVAGFFLCRATAPLRPSER